MDDAAAIAFLEPDSIEAAFPTDDDGLFDFMNFSKKTTGIDGVVFVSTRVGQHGPLVKWHPGPAGRDRASCSFSLETPPRLVASSLPAHVVARAAADVTAWVELNRAPLLAFWNDGANWLEDEVDAFKASLKSLPR